MFLEARTLSGFGMKLLEPVFAGNYIEPAVTVHVHHRNGLATTKVERVLAEGDSIIADDHGI
jgi:hypothetical protein